MGSASTKPTSMHAPIAFIITGLIALSYLWIASAGFLADWPQSSSFYQQLASAFRHGQTALLVQPSPELLAEPNPYRPTISPTYWIQDTLLYNKRYYLYWGPLPAVLVVLVQALLPITTLPDSYLAVAFAIAFLISGVSLLLLIQRTHFPQLSRSALCLGILLFGLCTPIPFVLARPWVYEAAIICGQWLLVSAIYWSYHTLTSHKPAIWMLVCAGGCAVLAAGARSSLLPALGLLGMLLVWYWYRQARQNHSRSWLGYTAAFGVPWLAGLAGLAWYNQIRFGAITEFGVRYQITAVPQSEKLFGFEYLLANLYNYTLRLPQWSEFFPYIYLTWDRAILPDWVALPSAYYGVEPIAGLLITAPCLLLAIVPLLYSSNPNNPNVATAPFRWLLQTLGLITLAASLPILFFFASSMRYALDFVPTLNLLAIIGIWQLLSLPIIQRWLAVLVRLVVASLSAATLICGVLLGFTGYFEQFRNNNPALYTHIQARSLALHGLLRPPQVLLYELATPNGVEDTDGRAFFWMGGGATTFELVSNYTGLALLNGRFEPGPSLPEYPERHLQIWVNGRLFNELRVQPGNAWVGIPVQVGSTRIELLVLDQPTITKLPNNEMRQLLLRVEELNIQPLRQ